MRNDLRDSELYKTVAPVAEGLNMAVIDVQHSVQGKVTITVTDIGGETTVDKLETFHRSVLSILELHFSRDELSVEVSSPGIDRKIRDASEFRWYMGRRARIFSPEKEGWLCGTVARVTDSGVELETDGGKTELFLFDEITKAKLDC